MAHRIYFLLVIIPILGGCQHGKENSKQIKAVGDIIYDSATDDAKFYLCNENEIMQYHNDHQGLQYNGEKIALVAEIEEKYNPPKNLNFSGLIRIRFIVNCRGETDRFRVTSVDEQFNLIETNQTFEDHIIYVCKSLKGWLPKKFEGQELDYYQYLIFKIINGQISEIMP
jgi:hypothetical protein